MPADSVIDAYREQGRTALPRGRAWAFKRGGVFARLLEAMGVEFATIDADAAAALDQAFPSRATALLPEWERELGLPDPLQPADQRLTTEERRGLVVAKWQAVGGQSKQFFIDQAARLGVPITITEFRPFRIGSSPLGTPLWNEDWAATWQVNAALVNLRYFRIGHSALGDPLRSWGNRYLEAYLEERSPADTILVFSYT